VGQKRLKIVEYSCFPSVLIEFERKKLVIYQPFFTFDNQVVAVLIKFFR